MVRYLTPIALPVERVPISVGPMKDADYDPQSENPYECFDCGTIQIETDDPGKCPECGGDMRNRRTPME